MMRPLVSLSVAVALLASAAAAQGPAPGEEQPGNDSMDFLMAAEAGDTATVERFLAAGMDPNTRAPNGETALHLAAGRGHSAITEALLKANASTNIRGELNLTPLHYAAISGDAQSATLLLDAGTPVDVAGFDSPSDGPAGSTPLLLAAELGKLDVVKLLVERGANVNFVNKFERTALFWANKSGNSAVAEFLVSQGAVEDPAEARANPNPTPPDPQAGPVPAPPDSTGIPGPGGAGTGPNAPDASPQPSPSPSPPPSPTPTPSPSPETEEVLGNVNGREPGTPTPSPSPTPTPEPLPPDAVPPRPVHEITAANVLGGPLSELWAAFTGKHSDWGLNEKGHITKLGPGVEYRGGAKIEELPTEWATEMLSIASELGYTVDNPDAAFIVAPKGGGAVLALAENERFRGEQTVRQTAERQRQDVPTTPVSRSEDPPTQ